MPLGICTRRYIYGRTYIQKKYIYREKNIYIKKQLLKLDIYIGLIY